MQTISCCRNEAACNLKEVQIWNQYHKFQAWNVLIRILIWDRYSNLVRCYLEHPTPVFVLAQMCFSLDYFLAWFCDSF